MVLIRSISAAAFAATLVAAGLAAAPSPAHAANARNPYGNVDRRNDAGNDTGNSETDRLNSMQLDQNYRGPTYAPGQPPPPAMAAPAPVPPPAYPGGRRGYYGR